MRILRRLSRGEVDTLGGAIAILIAFGARGVEETASSTDADV